MVLKKQLAATNAIEARHAGKSTEAVHTSVRIGSMEGTKQTMRASAESTFCACIPSPRPPRFTPRCRPRPPKRNLVMRREQRFPQRHGISTSDSTMWQCYCCAVRCLSCAYFQIYDRITRHPRPVCMCKRICVCIPENRDIRISSVQVVVYTCPIP